MAPHCGSSVTNGGDAPCSSSPQAKDKSAGAPGLALVRVLCLSEADRSINPLELQEDFVEISRSEEFVEIKDRAEIKVRFGGNLVCRAEVDRSLCTAVITSCLNEADREPEASKPNNSEAFTDCCSRSPIAFRPFSDNRLGFEVKVRTKKNPFPKGTISMFTVPSEQVLFETKLDLSRFL